MTPDPVNVPSYASTSICVEAEGLTNGDRRAAYGHPLDNFGRLVAMVNAFLGPKLKAPITEEEWGLINVLAKVSRCTNSMKRDSIVDIAGYANTVGMVMDKKKEMGL
jgi:hypothetical protein